ncbi:MAG: hypothetical protein LBS85_02060, partial [Clostridiales Family XIII bacterium]|nr:hypothetical protein [Clostridiales Family XIII bacterium]
ECRGGYSCGLIDLKAGTVLYIKVGSVGEANTDTNAVNKGGFNGGGDAKNSGVNLRTAGGGATDIRALEDDLCHRIMVAGGGGGNAANIAGAIAGYGGGTSGGSSYYTSSSTGKTVAATGGTQTAPGANKQTASTAGVPAGFGFGGSAPSLNLAGGGGGWFGGGAGSGGAGGSGYILYSKESTGTQYASAIIDGYFPEYKDFFFHGDGYNSIGIGGLLCTATSSSTDPITGSPAKNNGNGYITVAPGTKLWS